MVLVFAEDVVEEVYAVIQETFRDHPDLSAALAFLHTVFGAGELIARGEYRGEVAVWERQLRDPKDAPLAAAAFVAETNGLVTGDKDLLHVGRIGRIKVLRTRQLLDLLAGQR